MVAGAGVCRYFTRPGHAGNWLITIHNDVMRVYGDGKLTGGAISCPYSAADIEKFVMLKTWREISMTEAVLIVTDLRDEKIEKFEPTYSIKTVCSDAW